MEDNEIEAMLVEAVDAWLAAYKNLSFDHNGEEGGFDAYWHHKYGWDISNSDADPLSLLLLKEQPEREKGGDDCYATATLASYFGKSIGFIRSFQDGWFGSDNKHTSISGYVLGRKLRLKYQK